MSGFLKSDLMVALDDVDRIGRRIVTIYRDLSTLTADPDLAHKLERSADGLERAIERFDEARRRSGQIPEQEDPDRGHVQALWYALKSAVSSEGAESTLEPSLDEFDELFNDAIERARSLAPPPALVAALEELGSGSHTRAVRDAS